MDYNNEIIDFLLGNLTKEEMQQFNNELQRSGDLRKEVALQQEMLFAIKNGTDSDNEFRSQLKEIGDQFLARQEKKQVRFNVGMLYWGVAASIAIIVGVYFLLGNRVSGNPGADQLFAQYYETYEQSVTIRGDGFENDFAQLVDLFNSGNFQDALKGFEEKMSLKPEACSYYAGLCMMELGNFEKAYSYLLAAEKESFFYMEHIQWYKAMALLKMNKKKKVKQILLEIENSNSVYKEKAKKVLDVLI